MAGEDNGNGSERVNLRLSPEIVAYLERLAELGIHGKTPSEVAKTLIGREIERLIREDFLTISGRRAKRRRP